MKPNCIDISAWQENIDFQKVKAQGVQAVIIRAGFGQKQDKRFIEHYNGAKSAGLHIGFYWYSYADTPDKAEQEARAFLSVIKGKACDMPVYYDMEEDCHQQAGGAAMTAIAARFLDTVQAAGYRGGLYSSASWFADLFDYDALRRKYSIWLAQWASSHTRQCDIWQYGGAVLDGVDGEVDADIIENMAIIGGTPKGVTAQDAVAAAYALLGKDENPAKCDVMAWYGGFDDGVNKTACCCAGMMYLFFKQLHAGELIPGGKTANCGTLALHFYQAGQLHKPQEVQVGDLVTFSWSGNTTTVSPLNTLGYKSFDHVELCVEVNGTTIKCIGANNGGAECDDFQLKTRSKSSVSGCCRPKYADGGAEPTPVPTPTPAPTPAPDKALTITVNQNLKRGDKSRDVYVLQALLLSHGYGAGGVDGIFGAGTESAVRKYQSSHGLVSDGIAGKATFEELCG